MVEVIPLILLIQKCFYESHSVFVLLLLLENGSTTLFCSREYSGLLILRISKKAAFMFIGSTLIKSKVNLIFVCAFGIQRRSDLY